MEIVLKHPEVQRFIEDQVKEGRFTSPSELIEAALLRLMLNDTDTVFDDATLEAIRRADAQLDRGEGRDVRDAALEFRAKHKSILGSSNA